MVDSDTKNKSRLTPLASGIRRPPRPPLRVGLTMQDGDVCWPRVEAIDRIQAALRKSTLWYRLNNGDEKGVD